MTPFDSPAAPAPFTSLTGETFPPAPQAAPTPAPTPTTTPAPFTSLTGETFPPAPAAAPTPAPPAQPLPAVDDYGRPIDQPGPQTAQAPSTAAPAPTPTPSLDDYGRPMAQPSPDVQPLAPPGPAPTLGADTPFTPEDSPTLGGVVSQLKDVSGNIDAGALDAATRFGAGWEHGGQALWRNLTEPTFSPPTPEDQDQGPQDLAGRVGSSLAGSSLTVGMGGAGALMGAPLGPLGVAGGAGLGMLAGEFASSLRPAYVDAI